jgi:hypothetical protein
MILNNNLDDWALDDGALKNNKVWWHPLGRGAPSATTITTKGVLPILRIDIDILDRRRINFLTRVLAGTLDNYAALYLFHPHDRAYIKARL